MSIYRHWSRNVAVFVAPLIVALSALTPPAAAAGAGAGAMDGDVTYSGTYPDPTVVTYPVLYMYGRLDVAGQTYDGGFYISGLTAVDQQYGGGALCFACPTHTTVWLGRDAGAVHGFAPRIGAVNGECIIGEDRHTGTGPLYLVETDRQMTINCVASVLGGPPTPFTISVISHSDSVGHIVGVYTVA